MQANTSPQSDQLQPYSGELAQSPANMQLLVAMAGWLKSDGLQVSDAYKNVEEYTVLDSPDGQRHYNVSGYLNHGDMPAHADIARSIMVSWVDTATNTVGHVLYNGWNGFHRDTSLEQVDDARVKLWLDEGGSRQLVFAEASFDESQVSAIAADLAASSVNPALIEAATQRLDKLGFTAGSERLSIRPGRTPQKLLGLGRRFLQLLSRNPS